jgi:hypothetical protein
MLSYTSYCLLYTISFILFGREILTLELSVGAYRRGAYFLLIQQLLLGDFWLTHDFLLFEFAWLMLLLGLSRWHHHNALYWRVLILLIDKTFRF